MLLIGPTGCGKTALAQTLARRLNVPFAIGDATTLTEAGYVGEDVENLILKLVREADFDVPLAETGSFTSTRSTRSARRARTSRSPGTSRAKASSKRCSSSSKGRSPTSLRKAAKHPEQEYLQVNTAEILFICGGTFVGLEEIIGKRLGRKLIGFGRGRTSPTTRD